MASRPPSFGIKTVQQGAKSSRVASRLRFRPGWNDSYGRDETLSRPTTPLPRNTVHHLTPDAFPRWGKAWFLHCSTTISSLFCLVGNLHTCRSTVSQSKKGIVDFVNLSHEKAKNGKVQSIEQLKGEHWKREAQLGSASNRTKSQK